MRNSKLFKIWSRSIAAIVGLLFVIVAVWQLEAARSGVAITPLTVGATPASVYKRVDGKPSPVVVIAHGFAGSRQLMESYALTLAQSGYVAVSFDFEGHGRNPTPLSGDLKRIDGTTQLLMREVERVTDVALKLEGVDGRVALLGHSMASDIIVRQAIKDDRVKATVAVSMFSKAVTPTAPVNLLMISGEWEGFLRKDALRNLRLAEPSASEGQTIGNPQLATGRRVAVAPSVEHVGVLYSRTALEEAVTWLDTAFERSGDQRVVANGGMIVLLLAGIAILAWPLSKLLRSGRPPPPAPTRGIFLFAVLFPAVLTPLLLSLFSTRFLPVLVADYLAVHLFVFGLLSLAVLKWGDLRWGRIDWIAVLALAAYSIVVFGGALDRYVASFVPNETRLPIIFAIALGAVPYMLSESLAIQGGRAAIWRVLVARTAFLASLGIAVALDFERLFFLIIIIPVIVVFFTIFGLMGGWVGRRTNSPAAVGIALGVVMAWALGVSFPMFTPD